MSTGITRQLCRWVGALAVLGTLATISSDAMAQSRATRPTSEAQAKPSRGKQAPVVGKVDVEVMIVHATNSGRVDPKLEALKRQLNFTKYSGFELISAHPAALAAGQESSVNIVGGRKLKVTMLERNADSAKVRIRLSKSSDVLLDTTVRIHRNRVFTVAGPKHDGGVLIFPVSVSY